MQPVIYALVINDCQTFSILVRIEPHATHGSHHEPKQNECFQYPRADRASCNLITDLRIIQRCNFQYPRADRASCNLRLQPLVQIVDSPFSILVRIEPHATPWTSCSLACLASTFSILVRIEPHATRKSLSRQRKAQNFQYPRADRASCNL